MRIACVLSAFLSVSVCAAPSRLPLVEGVFSYAPAAPLTITPPTAIAPRADQRPTAVDIALLTIDLESFLSRTVTSDPLLHSRPTGSAGAFDAASLLSSALER